jgi:hypothetical protein
MFAWIDNRPPILVNERTFVLLAVFCLMAFLVSPKSPLPRVTQDRLVCWFPVGIFLYWFLFGLMLLSLNPHIHYYLGFRGVIPWTVNSGICYAFGIAFSVRMLRIRQTLVRILAVFWLVVFLLLLVGIQVIRPGVMET